jgi:hypothetical protein
MEREYLSYEELVEQLKSRPMTQYPALIIEIVKLAYETNTFNPGGASRMVENVEKQIGKDR